MVRIRSLRAVRPVRRQHAIGANHISYSGEHALRLTTDAPTAAIVHATPFRLHHTVTLMFGNTDQIATQVANTGTRFLERTTAHWQSWVRALKVPATWRDAAVRAAITHRDRMLLRANRRDHRIDHYFDSRGAQHKANVGLPILLAA